MKDMKDIVTKLIHIEKEIFKEMGTLNLFALLLREGEEKWDLLVSSPWIDGNKYDSVRYIASKLQKDLNQEELLEISGIIIIDDMSIIDDINKGIHKYPCNIDYSHADKIDKEHKYPFNIDYQYVDEIINYNLSGITIRRGYIMALHTSNSNLALA